MAANSQFAVAVHVLTVLAKFGGENVKSDVIAESVNTNPVVIRRLICDLNRAGLVVSQTGSSGGTQLARCPNELNLAEVYHAVSTNKVFGPHPSVPSDRCPVGKNIQAALEKLQTDVELAIDERLAKVTLNDILATVENVKCF
jgi:Rrf2 family protein